jgi:hypothetical protein
MHIQYGEERLDCDALWVSSSLGPYNASQSHPIGRSTVLLKEGELYG